MEITIRPYRADDLPRLQQIRKAAFQPVFISFKQIVGDNIYNIALCHSYADQSRLLDEICGGKSRYHVNVAMIGGEIAGFVSWTTDQDKQVGEVGLNAVEPGFWGLGIGTRMYAFALDRMRDAGMKVATVGTRGDPSHAPARRAYEKAGFRCGMPSLYLYMQF
jgi:GNAT superfamily N-acetyltransferase